MAADAGNRPMDEPNYELPAWLPWATTACLAALVGCLVELWIIERSRGELLREQAQLAESAAAAAQNQLEAERILDARQLEDLGAGREPKASLQVILLAPAQAGAAARGVAVVDPASGRGQLRLFGTPGQSDERAYQLWIDGPGPGYPASCGIFNVGQAGDGEPIGIRASVAPGCRLILIDGGKGGSSSLREAEAGGSIILASTPYKGGN
jgi:hypothetical protein